MPNGTIDAMSATSPLHVHSPPTLREPNPPELATPPYGPVERCPNCATTAIRPTVGDDRCDFRCDECGIRWNYALGHLIVL